MVKSTTIERYHAWKATAKPGDKFLSEGVFYTTKEFDAKIDGKIEKQINTTVIEEEDHADVGESNEGTISSHVGTGISKSAE